MRAHLCAIANSKRNLRESTGAGQRYYLVCRERPYSSVISSSSWSCASECLVVSHSLEADCGLVVALVHALIKSHYQTRDFLTLHEPLVRKTNSRSQNLLCKLLLRGRRIVWKNFVATLQNSTTFSVAIPGMYTDYHTWQDRPSDGLGVIVSKVEHISLVPRATRHVLVPPYGVARYR